MRLLFTYFFLFLICLCGLQLGIAQEIENSADVYLEEYSDEFQETFFEALKQKGIERYDRAVNLLLKCRKLDPNNMAVIHELSKAYTANKKYSLAEEHAVITVNSDPENIWYLQSLMLAIKKQGKNVTTVKDLVPYSNSKLKENLVKILYLDRNYPMALRLLKDFPESNFKTKYTTNINDSLEENKRRVGSTSFSARNATSGSSPGPMESYKNRIKFIIRQENYVLLNQIAKDALEQYPSQPYFYYALGLAQNKKGKHREAVKILETGLDYLLDDYKLADNIYKELGAGYNAMGNKAKAGMYLMKIKSKL